MATHKLTADEKHAPTEEREPPTRRACATATCERERKCRVRPAHSVRKGLRLSAAQRGSYRTRCGSSTTIGAKVAFWWRREFPDAQRPHRTRWSNSLASNTYRVEQPGPLRALRPDSDSTTPTAATMREARRAFRGCRREARERGSLAGRLRKSLSPRINSRADTPCRSSAST